MAKSSGTTKAARYGKSLSTRSIHAGEPRRKYADSLIPPIFQTSTYTYKNVKDIAQPFLDRPEKHMFYAILGQTSQKLSEWAEAIIYYKSYLAYYGTHIQILNSVGECYNQLGNKQEALNAWERSLELDPKQEQLRKLVENLKEKK